MGFENVRQRRGSEQGRDIDATLNQTRWFFECKCYQTRVSTPAVAYKFLQLDLLGPKMQPDFFVLLSNASTASILQDIVGFRNSEQHVRYSTLTWTNEPEEGTFNAILLSYPKVFLDNLAERLDLTTADMKPIVNDFMSRSEKYRQEHGRFFDNWRTAVPLFRKGQATSSTGQQGSFLHDEYLTILKREALRGETFTQVLIGIPASPVAGMHDFRSPTVVHALKEMLLPWNVLFVEGCSRFLVFGENWGDRTVLFDSGAIAVSSQLSGTPVVQPWEWLKALRENCLRMRNFCKKGLLLTPTTFRASVSAFHADWQSKYEEPSWHMGGIKRFLKDHTRVDSCNTLDRNIRSVDVVSDVIEVRTPFNMHDEIGKPLASTLWRNAGMLRPLLLEADDIDTTLFQQPPGDQDFGSQMEFTWSFMWLREGEVRDRTYTVFDEFIRRHKEATAKQTKDEAQTKTPNKAMDSDEE
jgi:hypothetical protein